MDSLTDILKQRKPQEPPQVAALKSYVREHYAVDSSVRVNSKHYVLTVPSAALAHRMRVETFQIIASCKLDKKLVIHIGY